MAEIGTNAATSTPAWNDQDLANPHAAADKASRVQRMFASIAPSYDLNNRLHSLGRDQAWRRAAVRAAEVKPDDVVLDVACGTGDLSAAFQHAGAARVIGVDFTVPMLDIADRKRRDDARGQSGSDKRAKSASLSYHAGDAMRLPLVDGCVDVVSIAFGIRNVADPAKAIAEFYRVLRPGGRLVILEFSLPRNALLRRLYNFYFHHIMPRTAALIARDRDGAYRYLPRSVNTFLDPEALQATMRQAGFGDLNTRRLTFGIAIAYRGDKG